MTEPTGMGAIVKGRGGNAKENNGSRESVCGGVGVERARDFRNERGRR